MNPDLKHIYSPEECLSDNRIKFICSIEEEYELICPAPVIYYDPVTYLPGFPIDSLHLEYRADFLIRHRSNGQAFLVELYPAFMADDARLWLRRRIAENYIASKGYDWQYRCLFQEYVQLNEEQSFRFHSYCQLTNVNARREWLNEYLMAIDLLKPAVFLAPEYSLLDFLIHGILPQHP